ncbi:MAG: hypothetical protein IJ011_00280 [Clostridia bacterium]|nr:hypothetical protein [Clostridia bacterium]
MTIKLYTAVGTFKQRRGPKGMTYPYVELGKQEYVLDMQEMVLWTVLNWRILDEGEVKLLYEKKLVELKLDYHKTFETCLYYLVQRGLIAEGKGNIGEDALYDLLSNLYVVPIPQNVLLRMFSFVRLTFKGVPLTSTRKLLKGDKRTNGEKKVMRIANQAIFSTAELIKCVEQDKTKFDCDEDILDALYSDEFTTSENIAYSVRSSLACRPVLIDVVNLYLRQQIVFGRM